MKSKFAIIFKIVSEFVKHNSIKLIIGGLSLITAGAIATTVWAVWIREPTVLEPDYAAKETEKDAEKIEGGENYGGEEIPASGGKISIFYSNEVTVSLSGGKAEMLIGNSAKSKHNIVAELVIQGEVILQTGAIMPGYRVVSLDIAESVKQMLQKGLYSGTIRLYLYDTQTNEREMLSSEIEAKILVAE